MTNLSGPNDNVSRKSFIQQPIIYVVSREICCKVQFSWILTSF